MTVITPPRGWLQLRPRELWAYRDLLFALAWRHIQVRYKQAVLGGLWAVLQPVAAAVAFTLVFRRMVGSTGDTPYIVFAFSGVLLWQLLASIVGTGSISLVDNAPLITKVFFPRLLVPLSVVAFSLLDFLIGSTILAVLMIWFRPGVEITVLLLPVAVAGATLCALGVSVFHSALTIKYRDFRFVVPFFIQLWFFLSAETRARCLSDQGFEVPVCIPTDLARFQARPPANPFDWSIRSLVRSLRIRTVRGLDRIAPRPLPPSREFEMLTGMGPHLTAIARRPTGMHGE